MVYIFWAVPTGNQQAIAASEHFVQIHQTIEETKIEKDQVREISVEGP
jgi:hypothetical protein